MDATGKELAHGTNKKMQGVNLTDLRDSDGKYYIKEDWNSSRPRAKAGKTTSSSTR